MRNEEYKEALAKAKEALNDLHERGDDAIGENALDYIESLMTVDERAESDLRVALIGELIKARHEKGITQKKLEELSGVKQPVIARMEKGISNPQIDTLIRLLIPLGKTLAVVPLESKTEKNVS
jgi:DNA-binding XRE family transcriptional regulator